MTHATFKPCRIRYQDQDYRIDSNGRVYWLCTINEQRIIDDLFLKELFAEVAKRRQNKSRREKDSTLRGLGLTKVKGSLGGTYWE